ncbi:MAG TPA: ABC transporter permease [Gemmatimonadales bacterium]
MSFGTTARRLRRRIRNLLHSRALDQELDDELRSHLEMEIEHNVRLGLDPDAARTKALREFGGVARTRDEARDARGLRGVEELARDLRHATRSLARSPGYTAVALLTIALGIGATTAVFSVVDGVLLRPLPFPAPDRLVDVRESSPSNATLRVPAANFHDVRRETRTLESAAYYSSGEETVLGADEPLRVRTTWVSREFFHVLGVRPLHGRLVGHGEGELGGPQVAVVSHAFWRTALGGDPDFSRRTLRFGEDAYPVVGVMPPGVGHPARTDVWVTFADDNPYRTGHNYSVIGRMRPDVTLDETHAELDAIYARLKAVHGRDMTADRASVTGLHEKLAESSRTTMLVLLGAVGCVLLVSCVNLASANLARGETRHRELAVRTALGAGRGRIVRLLVAENLALALCGGALGVLLALVLTRFLGVLGAGTLPRFAEIRVDGRVLAFAAAASLVTGVIVGALPAWRVTRDLRGAMGVGRGTTASRRLLVGAEVALALTLLAGAGLLVRSLRAVLAEERGFRTERVLTADLALPTAIYGNDMGWAGDTTRIAGFFDQLLPRLRAIPGVESVGLAGDVPLGDSGSNTSFMVDGGTEAAGDAEYRVVDSAYFATLGIPLLQGRLMGADDRAGAPHVVVVSRAMADRFWPAGDAMGRRLRYPGMDLHPDEWLTVVGVVGDVRHFGLDQAPPAQMYVPMSQRPERLVSGATLVLRATGSPEAIARAVREIVASVDANVPVEIGSMDALVADSVAPRRFSALLLGGFAGLALFLAAIGIYGVLSYSVARRTREIGVRMALGARTATVRAMVLRDAMRSVLPGVAVGLLGAWALARVLRGLLYEVTPADPLVFASMAVLLVAVSAVAAYLPARRATRVDPVMAIRTE